MIIKIVITIIILIQPKIKEAQNANVFLKFLTVTRNLNENKK